MDEPEIPGGRELIAGEMRSLGPVSAPGRVVAVVFGLAALAWIFRPLLETAVPGAELSDAGIAITAALVLFLAPGGLARAEFVLDWQWAGRLPWDVLLLFGGGLSVADALTRTGVAKLDRRGAVGAGRASRPAAGSCSPSPRRPTPSPTPRGTCRCPGWPAPGCCWT
ncbi:MAG TPA: anion permease [Longimicrobium sp.]|nr:anion permease [Longimicrobium sp.]